MRLHFRLFARFGDLAWGGQSLWRILARLRLGGRTRNRGSDPGARSWIVNRTFCLGEDVRNAGAEASLELPVRRSPAVLCCETASLLLVWRMDVCDCGFVCKRLCEGEL